jgi:hypothetical protein
MYTHIRMIFSACIHRPTSLQGFNDISISFIVSCLHVHKIDNISIDQNLIFPIQMLFLRIFLYTPNDVISNKCKFLLKICEPHGRTWGCQLCEYVCILWHNAFWRSSGVMRSEDFYFLGYNAVQSAESQPTFRRNKHILPSASCWFLAWLILRRWRWSRHFPLKYWLTFSFLHNGIFQKT